MRHLRMVGLSLVAVFAITAITATSASALPEWGKCVKLETKTGTYSDANCTTKAKPKLTGEFNWVKGAELANVKFSGENVGAGGGGVLTSTFRACLNSEEEAVGRFTRAKCKEMGDTEGSFGPIAVECESESNFGEASGKNLVLNISVKFLGCKVFGSLPCSNGPIEGEIQVNPLKGKLGYISKPEHKAGVLLEPVKKHGEFVKFNCGGILGTVVGVGNKTEGANYEDSPGVESHGGYDGIISPIEPVNTMTSKYTQVYTVNPETNENIPSKFEGKHIELLEDYLYNPTEPWRSLDWSAAGEEITNENTAAEPGELKA